MPSLIKSDSALGKALAMVRRSLGTVFFFSAFINVLALTSSVYMLQVYDRVLASRSLPTLAYLTLFAAGALFTLGLLEVIRSKLLIRMGVRFDAALTELVFCRTLNEGRSGQALRDVEQLRAFVTGPPMVNLLDVPWMPLYVLLVYLLHPWLGHVAVAGGLALLGLGLWNERASRSPLAEASREIQTGNRFTEMAARNAEAVQAMGMLPGLTKMWRRHQRLGVGLQAMAGDRAAEVSGSAKALRMFIQVGILGVGSWLVILGQLTPGVMIAASIVVGRALAPIESAIGSWRSYLGARESFRRLREDLGMLPEAPSRMPLPKPTGRLDFQDVSAAPPRQGRMTVSGLRFKLQPGQCLGITGPSGSGKSTIARLAVGYWRPAHGTVRLDDVDLSDWPREDVGPWIGYLPQDVELFPGTIAQNICRFAELNAQEVVKAAQLAGAHTMILTLPDGYDTVVSPSGENLSGGQRQRIGLARAFYQKPPLLVLDEPTSNMDAEGEASVRQALDELRQLGHTLIVISHRPALLAGTTDLMVVVEGKITALGPTHTVMPNITRRVVAPAQASMQEDRGGHEHRA